MAKGIAKSFYQPEDPWEVREGLLEGDKEKMIFIAVRKQRLAMREQLGGRLFRRFWSGIRLWKAVAKGIAKRCYPGVYQPEDPWEVREGLLERDKEKRIFTRCLPARRPVGGKRRISRGDRKR